MLKTVMEIKRVHESTQCKIVRVMAAAVNWSEEFSSHDKGKGDVVRQEGRSMS